MYQQFKTVIQTNERRAISYAVQLPKVSLEQWRLKIELKYISLQQTVYQNPQHARSCLRWESKQHAR